MAYSPKSRRAFWSRKFKQNVTRDSAVIQRLRQLGWRVTVIWECEAEHPDTLQRRLRDSLP